MKYTLIEESDGAIEVVNVSSPPEYMRLRTPLDDGGFVVGYIDSDLPLPRLRAGLRKHESQREEDALDRLYKIKRLVLEI